LRRLRVAGAGVTNRHRALAAWLTVLGDLALRRASDSAKTAHPAGPSHAAVSTIAAGPSHAAVSTIAAGPSHAAVSSGAPVAVTAISRSTPNQSHHRKREDTQKTS
jgi:hypothetical protein